MGLNLKANVLASAIAAPATGDPARLAAVNLLRASEATVTASADESGGEKENAYEQGFTFDFWRTGGSGTHWLRGSFTPAVISGETLSLSALGTSPQGVTISADGRHLYSVDSATAKASSFTLSTPFDLFTAVYDGAASDLDVSGQDTAARDISISSDGKHLYVMGVTNVKVYAYTLAVAHDLSTAVHDGAASDLDVSGQDTSPRGLVISSDGLHLYIAGLTNSTIYAYTLGVAHDLSTAVYDGAASDLDVSGEDVQPTGVTMSSNGLKLFVVGFAGAKVHAYQLGTAFDLGTATYRGSNTELSVTAEDGAPRGIAITPDAAKLYMVGDTNNKVYAYTIGVASNYLGIAAHDLHNHGATVKAQNGNALSLLISALEGSVTGVAISSDGLHAYIVGGTNKTVFSYTLSAAHDLRSATYDGASFDLDVSGQDTAPEGLAISNDGTVLFMLGNTNKTVFAYDMTAFDLSTAVYNATDDLIVNGEDTVPLGITISSTGLRLYMVGFTNGKVYQYDLGVADDLSSAVYSATDDLTVSGQDGTPRDLAISSDGLHLYVAGDANNKVYAYTFGVAYDGSSLTYDGAGFDLDVSGQDTVPTGLSISSDGLHLFLAGVVADRIFAYSMTPAYDLSSAEHLTWLDSSDTFTPRTSAPILMLFDDVVALNHRLLIVVTSEPSIGAVHLGCALTLDAPLPAGYSPPQLALQDKHLVERSETGLFLGRSIVAARAGLAVDISGLDLPWLRSRWESHVRLIEQFPFFWSSGDQPKVDGIAEGGAFYGWVTGQPTSAYDTRVYGAVTLRAGGIVS